MSWLSDIISGGGEGLLKGVGEVAKDIREAITGKSIIDPNKQAEIEMKLLEIQNKTQEWEYLLAKGQLDINIEEVKNTNILVSGWRPFIGWVCGVGIAWQFILSPLIEWVCKISGKTIIPPTLDTAGLMGLVIPLLGLGGLRTYEKIKGTQNSH